MGSRNPGGATLKKPKRGATGQAFPSPTLPAVACPSAFADPFIAYRSTVGYGGQASHKGRGDNL